MYDLELQYTAPFSSTFPGPVRHGACDVGIRAVAARDREWDAVIRELEGTVERDLARLELIGSVDVATAVVVSKRSHEGEPRH